MGETDTACLLGLINSSGSGSGSRACSTEPPSLSTTKPFMCPCYWITANGSIFTSRLKATARFHASLTVKQSQRYPELNLCRTTAVDGLSSPDRRFFRSNPAGVTFCSRLCWPTVGNWQRRQPKHYDTAAFTVPVFTVFDSPSRAAGAVTYSISGYSTRC